MWFDCIGFLRLLDSAAANAKKVKRAHLSGSAPNSIFLGITIKANFLAGVKSRFSMD